MKNFSRDGDIVLREAPKNLTHAFELLKHMSDVFFELSRNDEPPQDREIFWCQY